MRCVPFLGRASAAAIALASAGGAAAQVAPQVVPGAIERQEQTQRMTDLLRQTDAPQLTVINGVSRRAGCESAREGGFDVWRNGIDPRLEIVSGDTGLVLIGKFIDKATSVQIISSNRTITGTIERRIAAGSVCGPDTAGMAAIVVRFNIPDNPTITAGDLEVLGNPKPLVTPRNLPRTDDGLCDGGEIGRIPCPPKVTASVPIKIVPRPTPTTINPATRQTANDERYVRVVGLEGQRMAAAQIVPQSGIGHRDVNAYASSLRYLVDFYLQPNQTKRVEPRVAVALQRGGQVRPIEYWDTANAGGTVEARRFSRLGFDVARGAATPAPSPAPTPAPTPAPSANLDPYDPGNKLYKTNGSAMDSAGNIYSGLTRMDFCQGIAMPGGTSSNILANRRETTIPNIRWGVINRGAAAAPAGAQLQLLFDRRVVATFTVNQAVPAGGVVLAPDYVRPDSTNTTALLTGGGVCYHAGLPNEGWTDNGGYTIKLLTTNEVEAID